MNEVYLLLFECAKISLIRLTLAVAKLKPTYDVRLSLYLHTYGYINVCREIARESNNKKVMLKTNRIFH